jgi:hypothetical protein
VGKLQRDEGRRKVMSYYGFRPYLPVAKRRLLAARELEKLKKKGHIVPHLPDEA